MLAKIWTGSLLFLAWIAFCAWLIIVCREKDVHPIRDFLGFFKDQSTVGRVLFGAFFIVMFLYGSIKHGDGGGSGGGGGDGGTNDVPQMVPGPGVGNLQPMNLPGGAAQGLQGQTQFNPTLQPVNQPLGSETTLNLSGFEPITSTNTTHTLTGDDFRRGFVMYRVGTDEEFDFSAPPGATVCSDWRAFGAATDWIYVAFANWAFQVGTNEIDRLRLFSFGKIDPLVREADGSVATNSWFAPFMASLGIVPEANWDLLAESDRPSRLWHCITLQNSLVVTWQNALLDRDTDTPLSFQAEFFPGGRFAYRYDLSRLNVETVSNILAGASFGGNGWTTNALPTNVTSMAFYPLSEEDAANQDSDGDGLSLLDELFAFGTDPDLRDTDCDGVSDGDEVAAGTNPRSRDSDGDGLVDGSDPDSAAQTSLADLDGDGIPDAYEDYWFGGTNAFNTATNRDDTGFTLGTKILGGINPTNAVAAANVVSTNGLVSWKLFDAFAADWPANATNLVWERTFTVGRSCAWQQFFVSASPTNAAAWSLRGAVLEWETDTGVSGTVAASPSGDSFRIPLSAEDFPYELTLRIRAAGAVTVYSPAPLHLIAYAPEFRIGGGNEITGDSGAKFSIFTGGSDSRISLVIDHALRPCNATPGCDEGDMTEFENLSMTGSDFSFAGDTSGGTIHASRPGIYTLPDYSLGVSFSVPLRFLRRSGRRGGGGHTIVVLDPSVSWNCAGHGCGYDGLGYDWYGDSYYEEEYYPLDSKCLRKKWHHDWGGGWRHDGCELSVSSGIGDGNGLVTASSGGVYVDGVLVWTGSAEHVYDDWGCGGCDDDYLGDECDSCDEDCANGNCDSLEGTSLGSLKFRIPLGAPVKGQVAGFVWFSTDGPVTISRSTFQLLEHPDAHVSDYLLSSGTRRVVCCDSRGRDLRIENMANGARITIYDTDAQTLEHTWRIENVNGSASQVRLKKISRLDNVMSDETYTYADGDWTRFDNIAGVGTQLTTYDDFAEYGDGVKSETRTTTDAAGNTLSVVTTEKSRIGACDNAVIRETYREESTWNGVKRSRADYWNDPAHSSRHGQPRLVWGDARAWKYMDYDENGHETLLVEQRGCSPMPSAFPYVVSNELHSASGLADAFVTVRDFTPLSGDSGHRDDAARPRIETRYVVTNGVATPIGRTWTRYTRLNRDGHAAIRAETWRAGAQGAAAGDAGNAYSYKITYADTGEGTPLLMRNAAAETLDENGILTVNAYSLSGGVLSQTSRRFFLSQEFPTCETVELNASYGTVLRRTTRLTDGDTVIADEQSIYDSRNRLRSTTYLDGTSLTNAYSCCRLLWKRDREGRKTLRSAKTGADHLYSATEDVWLADVSTNGRYRVTQHFYDALGRETNTVTYAGATPGEAVEASAFGGKAVSSATTAYPYGGGDYAVRTDERGKVTVTEVNLLDGGTETVETVLTNGVALLRTIRRTWFGGGSSVRREWAGVGPGGEAVPVWTEECRFEDYAADGRRIEYVVTESSDCGTVTNSVSTCDLLGRLVTSSAPGADGATIVTSNAYDGTTSRLLSATVHAPGLAPRTAHFLHGVCGEQVGVAQDGVTNRTDVTYETDPSNVAWRVETSTLAGPDTNSLAVTRTRLTGLSDAIRRHVVETAGRPPIGRRTEIITAFNPSTGIETETVASSFAAPVVRHSLHGLVLTNGTAGTATAIAYDAFGRVATTFRRTGNGEPLPLRSFAYSPAGDVVAMRTYTNATGAVAETYGYDALGNRTVTTDALGNAVHRTYDSLGRILSEDGATYPVRHAYDTQGRRISLSTTSDGAEWDETRWTYDAATGLCTAKTYADGSTVTHSHTPDGLPLRTEYAGGRWTENVYDERRRTVGTLSGDGESDTLTVRDTYGRIVSESNAAASASYSLADGGAATNETVSVGGDAVEIVRSLDSQDRPAGLSIPSAGYSLRYAYAEDGNVAAISNAIAVIGYAYTPERLDAGCTLTLSNGVMFTRSVARDAFRRSLVAGIVNSVNGAVVEDIAYAYDALNRPVSRNGDRFGYGGRGEVVFSRRDAGGPEEDSYCYDGIGNLLVSSLSGVTNTYTANALNQYTSLRASAPPCETIPHYDADGNMTRCGEWEYAYDSAGRLSTISSNGVLLVANSYDAKGRRVRQAASDATTVFFYDGWNLIVERIVRVDGTTSTIRYYWGKDLSGTFHDAGGIGGLLYITVDDIPYVPTYDGNGNVRRYLDTNGSTVAQYTYDAFGKTVSATGPLAHLFRHRFSTKCFDPETGLCYYGCRFYSPFLMRWLSRDPIGEDGGLNLYTFCGNNAIVNYDKDGHAYFAKRELAGYGWSNRFSDNGFLDKFDIELSHEQLFYGTPDNPLDDIGYFDDGMVKNDPYRSKYKYVVTDSGYDDCVMKKAVSMVQPHPYNYLGFLPKRDNCQSYANRLRQKYAELLNDEQVMCECFGRKEGQLLWMR